MPRLSLRAGTCTQPAKKRAAMPSARIAAIMRTARSRRAPRLRETRRAPRLRETRRAPRLRAGVCDDASPRCGPPAAAAPSGVRQRQPAGCRGGWSRDGSQGSGWRVSRGRGLAEGVGAVRSADAAGVATRDAYRPGRAGFDMDWRPRDRRWHASNAETTRRLQPARPSCLQPMSVRSEEARYSPARRAASAGTARRSMAATPGAWCSASTASARFAARSAPSTASARP